MPSRNPFVCGNPQTKTTTLRMIQGSQARIVSEARASGRASLEGGVAGSSAISSARDALPDGRASDTRQILFGCQNLKKSASEAIETIAATTSTNHGP